MRAAVRDWNLADAAGVEEAMPIQRPVTIVLSIAAALALGPIVYSEVSPQVHWSERLTVTHQEDLEAVARAIIDANLYMTLGTADMAGRPWVSPVYYAVAGYTELFWVSAPDATHSRSLETRPELRIAIFDSQAPINTGQGV